MNHFRLILSISIAFLLFTSVNYLKAQYIIEQIEYEIPVCYDLIPEDVEFEEPEDESNFFLNIPESKLKEAASAEGREIKEERSTIYIDGEDFAVETESGDMGKVTMVSDTKTGMIYLIMWSQKKVIEMKPEDMAKIEEKTKAATEKMLENLPLEMHEQVQAEMEKEKNKPRVKYEAKPTGKKMMLNGFNCEEYLITKEDEYITIWASGDKSEIVNEVDRISRKFDNLFRTGEDEEVDEWQLIPGKIPVQVKTYRSSMMTGEPSLTIQTITGIENRKPSADKFRVPGENEGFTKGAMMDMMMQMMPQEE